MTLAMNDFVLESLVDDDLDIQRVLASLLQRQERTGRSGIRVRSGVPPADPSKLSPSHDAPAADLLLIDLTPAREGDAQRCRVLRPRSELSALILKVVDGDNTDNADDRQDEWNASPVSTGDLFAKALELTETHESPSAPAEPPHGRTAHFADWTLDLALHVLSTDDSPPIALPHTEFSLLLAFLDHPRQVLARDELVACTRATTRNLSTRTVDVYVSRLRRRLASGRRGASLIETRHRQGYVLNADPAFA
jgi:two-component system, OmpR family, response regulator